MRVLIVTIPGDAHAHAVSWGLEQLGHVAVKWYPADLSAGATWDFDPTSNVLNIHHRDVHEELRLGDFDGIWMRRVPLVVHLPAIEEQNERAAAETEMAHFIVGICQAAEKETPLCVNPISKMWGAERKIGQLSLASRLGLRVPKTRVTNRLAALQAFHASQDESLIWKPLKAFLWSRGDGHTVIPPTTRIESLDIFETADVANSPAIYQELIDKAVEIRAVIMGQTVFAFETRPISGTFDQVDWRFEHGTTASHAQHQLPQDIADRCLSLARSLGLLYAAIDLAIDQTGNYIFFEINPGGQFLFGEDLVPDMPLLDAFCKFLVSRDPNFVYEQVANPIRFFNYTSEVDFEGDVDLEIQGHAGILTKYHFARVSIPLFPQ